MKHSFSLPSQPAPRRYRSRKGHSPGNTWKDRRQPMSSRRIVRSPRIMPWRPVGMGTATGTVIVGGNAGNGINAIITTTIITTMMMMIIIIIKPIESA